MDVTRPADRPYGSHRFSVEIAGGRSRPIRLGFCTVLLPPFDAPGTKDAAATPDAGAPPRLVLRRGFTGSLELYRWWQQSRSGRIRGPRRVTVELLDEQLRPVVAWRFLNARPARLSYSPLDAQVSALLIESLEIGFDMAEMR